jgi:hypothetical protein
MTSRILTAIIVGEGSSDALLEHPIRWLLDSLDFQRPLRFQFSHRSFPGEGLRGKLQLAIELYAPQIIFVHRDSDNTTYTKRKGEIDEAITGLTNIVFIPAITVRMMEAWLLTDESAIRTAAGNPKGKHALNLPKVSQLESIADPKSLLFEQLRTASGKKGRQLKKFSEENARRFTAEETEDFSPLLALSAFQALQEELQRAVSRIERID